MYRRSRTVLDSLVLECVATAERRTLFSVGIRASTEGVTADWVTLSGADQERGERESLHLFPSITLLKTRTIISRPIWTEMITTRARAMATVIGPNKRPITTRTSSRVHARARASTHEHAPGAICMTLQNITDAVPEQVTVRVPNMAASLG